jgi:division protein 1
VTATSLAILENAEPLARLALDEAALDGAGDDQVSLIRGFRATIPSSELSKQRRRMLRGEIIDGEIGATDGKLGLKQLGERARGLLTEGGEDAAASSQLAIGRKSRRRKKKRESRRHSTGETKLHLEDLLQQADEIAQDKENLRIRQVRLASRP